MPIQVDTESQIVDASIFLSAALTERGDARKQEIGRSDPDEVGIDHQAGMSMYAGMAVEAIALIRDDKEFVSALSAAGATPDIVIEMIEANRLKAASSLLTKTQETYQAQRQAPSVSDYWAAPAQPMEAKEGQSATRQQTHEAAQTVRATHRRGLGR